MRKYDIKKEGRMWIHFCCFQILPIVILILISVHLVSACISQEWRLAVAWLIAFSGWLIIVITGRVVV